MRIQFKKIFVFISLVTIGIVLGFCLGRMRPSISSSSNDSAIKLYNQYRLVKIDPDCPIKGNVSKSSKIYHMPGGQFYDRITKPEECFENEQDAALAGYKKSGR